MITEPLVEVLDRLSGTLAGLRFSVGSLSSLLAGAGWTPIGTPKGDEPARRWRKGDVDAFVRDDENRGAFLEFTLRIVRPDSPEGWVYSEDVDAAYEAAEVNFIHEADQFTEVLAQRHGVPVGAAQDESLDYIVSRAWEVLQVKVHFGVIHPDRDLPIFFTARIYQS